MLARSLQHLHRPRSSFVRACTSSEIMSDRNSSRGGRGGHRGGGRGGRGRGGGGFRGGRGGGRGGRGDIPWYRQEGYNDGVASSVDETEVGIKAFVSDVKGFNGIVKQRFSDFIVREVATNGTDIARLTELELPPQNKKNRSVHTLLIDAMEGFLGLSFSKSSASKQNRNHSANPDTPAASPELESIFDQLSKRLVDLFVASRAGGFASSGNRQAKKLVAEVAAAVNATEAASLEAFLSQVTAITDPTVKSDLVYHFQPLDRKEDRTALHGLIREFGNELVVADTTNAPGSDAQTVIRLRPLTKGTKRKDMDHRGSKNDANWPHNRPNYVKFVLYKKNKETVDAMQHMAKLLYLNDNTFSYAGTKDKRGLTTQWVTAYRVPRETIARINNHKNFGKNYDMYPFLVGNFSYVAEPLTLGDLYGNQFGLVLRNIPQDVTDEAIATAVKSWASMGFVNYFGLQRFGTKSIPSHVVGRTLLRKDFKGAVDLILGPKEGDASKIKEARVHFQQYKDISAALRMFPPFLVAEVAVLEGFSRFGLDAHERAIRNIPTKLRMIYTHAYQSYIWNEAASYRLQKYSNTAPVVGDMVLRGDVDVDPEAEVEAKEDTAAPKKRRRFVESDIIYVTEDNISEYSIEDVVLPVHGYSTLLPKNSVADVYSKCASQDGVDFEMLRKDQAPEYNLPGSYRHILRKPQQVRHEVKRYDDETIPLIPSEVDLFLKRPSVPSLPNGKYKAICLEFTLQSSSYATIAIRELLKQSSSIHVQLQLNEQQAGKAIDTTGVNKTKSIPIGRPGFSLGKK
ncbi:tRNA pseudouridine synthase D (TruD) [Achlya hypogyna]|uniref:tRNA pseudouridine synthase D (TruD) n=1 Tax=Achlya hypogyna TaxID=1202772 RepID=A0A1V9ZSP4_ACHHY|nr:tRNA pseudouridine synthase D (TruD) [Achlya hypogyna]